MELASAWRAGDASRARTLGHALARMSAAAFAEPNPSVVKGVLHAQGRIPTPAVRLPLLPASPEAVADTLERLAELKELAEPA
ncbi:dihydrodipicolinate synthase family protein [Streptomyces sp. NPDC002990]